MSVKDWVHRKINDKAAKREKLKEEIAQRSRNVEAFVLKLLEELDDNISSAVNASLFDLAPFRALYVKSIEERLRTLDSGIKVEVLWASQGGDGTKPRVNGILVKWSMEYQVANACDPELYIDMTALLLKNIT